jgi:hypothetical protein
VSRRGGVKTRRHLVRHARGRFLVMIDRRSNHLNERALSTRPIEEPFPLPTENIFLTSYITAFIDVVNALA